MNSNTRKQWLLTICAALLFILVACGGTTEEPAAEGTLPVQETNEAATPTTVDMNDVTDEPSDGDTPQEMPEPGIPNPEAYMTDQARLALADRLGVDVETISVVSVEEREWSDAALGCAEPGQMYAQVITPGFEITLSVNGETYSYHSDMNGILVLCDADGQPVERTEVSGAGEGVQAIKAVTPAVVDLGAITSEPRPEEDSLHEAPAPGVPNASSIVANRAAQALAESLSIDVEAVEIVSVQRVEWRDSSLGCARPGQNYLMVITPGFRIMLEADGEQYEYHSDMQGNMVRCGGNVQDGGVKE